MFENAHLPAAVTEGGLEAIAGREDCEIRKMADECGRWLASFAEYRASLVTPSAMTVWTALVQDEFDRVSETFDRLTDEIRIRSGAADAAPS